MRRTRIALALVALVLAAAAPASAARFGVSGFTGYQSYAMDDINGTIAAVNEELSTPGDLSQIDELSGDPSFGLGLRLDLGPRWRVTGEYEHLSDDTGGGNLIGSFNVDVTAASFLVGATYFFPSSSKARLGLGAGVGLYEFGGEANLTGTVGSTPFAGAQDLGGSTVGFHGRGELDVMLSDRWHFDAALGYRAAKGELEADGQATGTDLDWSGIMTRVGFTLFLN